ncbi:hypothetical protein [Bdellovibrio sp. NC01]|uniref:hypothetical protein n=1 Tax=Bdellovibrio sp. NC01 TaxID=2220073 RepID=UPI00115B1B8E|nr:hypothetical protein [Bdellovibrio sp. NC01]QDK37107.1 hypothetical protein DOE51_05630 [Bdellovibrio sp. NC01]
MNTPLHTHNTFKDKAAVLLRYSRLNAHHKYSLAKNRVHHLPGVETCETVLSLLHTHQDDMVWDVEERDVEECLFENEHKH